ncbi:hypothetical protein JS562_32095, partial [Agrobacterium sp. S2]|nr:hypothetical protein [Agrobacterium sp. S2]
GVTAAMPTAKHTAPRKIAVFAISLPNQGNVIIKRVKRFAENDNLPHTGTVLRHFSIFYVRISCPSPCIIILGYFSN